MNNFANGYRFGGGFGQNIPFPGSSSGVVSSGLNIYNWVNIGLHFSNRNSGNLARRLYLQTLNHVSIYFQATR